MPCEATFNNSSSGMLLHRKNDSRDASSRSLTVVDAARRHARRIGLRPEQELGTRQNQPQRVFDARFKASALIAPRLIETQQRFHVAVGHRPPVCPPRQRGQNLLRARHFVGRIGGRTNKYPPPAGGVARPGGFEWPRHLHVIDQRDAVHVLQIQIARERLQRLVRFRRIAPQERHRDIVRPRLHMHLGPQPGIQRVARQRQIGIHQLEVFFAAHRRDKHALAIDTDLKLMRKLHAGQVADDIPQQEDVELVVGVQREIVMDQDSAARPQRQPLDVLRPAPYPAARGNYC